MRRRKTSEERKGLVDLKLLTLEKIQCQWSKNFKWSHNISKTQFCTYLFIFLLFPSHQMGRKRLHTFPLFRTKQHLIFCD